MTGDLFDRQNIAVVFGDHAGKVFALMQNGFFEMRKGSMTVHFDEQGRIRKVEKHLVETYP